MGNILFYYKCLTPNPFESLLTYSYAHELAIGQRVLMPYGKKNVFGIVWEQDKLLEIDRNLIKNILNIEKECLPSTYILWMIQASNYYHVNIVAFVVKTLPVFFWSPCPELDNDYINFFNFEQFPVPVSMGAMTQLGLIKYSNIKKIKDKLIKNDINFLSNDFQLSYSQMENIEKIHDQGFFVHLLHGPTGSGKTEVYLHHLCKLAKDAPVLLMLPEIALTQNIIDRLIVRLGCPVWVYHSKLSKNTRMRNYQAAMMNAKGLWIGTRSALFLPCSWSMVVMDEEHDDSYLQTQKLYFSTKNMLIMRAKIENFPIILGSATPSLETVHMIKNKGYNYLYLHKYQEVNIKPEVFDMKKFPISQGIISPIWHKVDKFLSAGFHVLFFLNRRGYAPVLYCKSCEWKSFCPNCDAMMVIHAKDNKLYCHHCCFSELIPSKCPSGHDALIALGQGTQRLEENIKKKYSHLPIVRIDQDSNKEERDYFQKMLLHEGACVFIGTQMITKGIDAPFIKAVVIVNLDNQLLNTEFSADEKVYQTVTQVMGRACRRHSDISGLLLVQTYFPNHPLWLSLQNNNLDSYPDFLLKNRYKLNLPPYTYYCCLRIWSKNEDVLKDMNIFLHKKLKNVLVNAKFFGLFPHFLKRKNTQYQYVGNILTLTRNEMDYAINIVDQVIKSSGSKKFDYVLERDADHVVF